MAERVEIPVSLGLQQAIQQAQALKKVLDESVNPDSSGYRDILKILDKIDKLAGGLKGKLGSSFSTSKSSSRFLSEYEKLLSLLEAAKKEFSQLGLSEIKLSVDDSNKVEEYTKKIEKLQAQIDALQGTGKVGGLFKLDEFKEAAKLLEQLKIDPSNFTLQGLTDTLKKELEDAQEEVHNLESQFANADHIIKNLGGEGPDKLSESLKRATENAAGLVRKIGDNETKIDVNAELKRTFEALDGVDLKARFINSDTNIDKFINEETKRIVEAYDTRIAELTAIKPEVDRAMNQLKGQKTNADTLAIINSDSVRNAFKALNLEKEYQEFIAKAKEQGESGAQAIASAMSKTLSDAINIDELKSWKESARSAIEDIFVGLGETTVAKAAPFKKALQDIFTSSNIDITNTPIQTLINQIKEGDNVADIINNIVQALEAYIQASSEGNTENAEQYQQLVDKVTLLRETIESIGNAWSNSVSGTEEIKSRIDEFLEKINKLRHDASENIKIKVDDTDLKKGETALNSYINTLSKYEKREQSLSSVQMAVTRWMGFYQILNLTKRAINDMKQHVQELDSVMTKIAVVTNMSQKDLWGQIGQYSEIARSYGVAIKGAYEVSQIYYQQGLNKSDVMGLTTETLKMARIAGIDYSTAADYMTTAIRGFKLEMSEAVHVTDVFSNLAAHTASNTEELATAISKTAASAASVGASFESTSAMMATMISTTRESATNIGTALKSIISRYGEMKANPTGVDAEGESYSLNKVDTALQSIGIKIHDVNGQFRNFDDVILELAEAWEGVDKNTQRYIATVMAGNRQQSRFLSLVSNVEEYKRALALANDSDDSGEIQTLKTLDSIDAKIEQMKVTVQEFYTNSGIENLYKGILDTITNVISAANALPKTLGNLPITAMAIGMQIVNAIKNLVLLVITHIRTQMDMLKTSAKNVFTSMSQDANAEGHTIGRSLVEGIKSEMGQLQGQGGIIGKFLSTSGGRIVGNAASALLSTFGATLSISALNKYGSSTDTPQDKSAASSMFAAAGLQGISSFISGTIMSGGNPMVGAITGLISTIPSLISAITMNTYTLGRDIELSSKRLQEAKQNASVAKGKQKDLSTSIDKLKELESVSHSSAEAMDEYKEYMNQLAESYPELVSAISDAGDATIQLSGLESALAQARLENIYATAEAIREEKKNKVLQKTNYGKLAQINSSLFTPNNLYKILNSKSDMNDITDYNAEAQKILQSYNSWATQNNTQKLSTSYWDAWSVLNDSKNKEYLSAFFDDILKQKLSHLSSVGTQNYTSDDKELQEAIDSINIDSFKERYINALKEFKENADKATGDQNITVSYSMLTGEEIDDLEKDIKEWDMSTFLKAMETTKRVAKECVQVYNNEIDNLDELLSDTKLDEQLQTRLNETQSSTKKDYNKYKSLIANMVKRRYGENIDWTTTINRGILDNFYNYLIQWIDNHAEEADYLMNDLDIKSFSNESDLKKALSEKGGFITNNPLPTQEGMLNGYIKQLVKNLETAREQIDANIKSMIVDKNGQADIANQLKLQQLFTSSSIANNSFTTDMLDAANSSLETYRKLTSKGYSVAADNYIEGLSLVFTAIGKLNSDQQTSILPLIKDLDLQDATKIDDAIKALTGQSGMGGLITALKQAREQIYYSVTTLAQQYADKAKDVTESIEKAYGQMNKSQKYSDIIEITSTLLSKNKNLKFEDLIRYDEDLQSYVLTEAAVKEQIVQSQSEFKENVKDLDEQAQKEYDFIKQLDVSAGKNINTDNVILTQQEIQQLGIAGDRRAQSKWKSIKQIALSDAKNSEDPTKWKSERLEAIQAIHDHEIELLKSLDKNSAILQLASFNWESIASGNATSYNKDQLRLLLEQAGVQPQDMVRTLNPLWTAALRADIDGMNKALQHTGFKISDKAGASIIAARISAFQTALKEVTSNWNNSRSWSKETKSLLKSKGMMDSSDNLIKGINQASVIASILADLRSKIGQGNYTTEQYNQDYLQLQQMKGYGKTSNWYNLLEGGFSLDDLQNYFQSLGLDKKVEEYFDESTHELKDGIDGINFSKFIKYDELTGKYEIDTSKTFDQIKDDIIQGLHLTEEEAYSLYTDAQDRKIQREIKNAKNANVDVASATQLKSLAGAQLGDYIDVSKLNENIKNVLGITGDWLQITTEHQIDNYATQLEAIINDTNTSAEDRKAAQDVLDSIRGKTSEFEGIKGILSRSVSQSAATAYHDAIHSTRTVAEEMKDLDFIWDEKTKQWKSQATTLGRIRTKIAQGGLSTKELNELKAMAEDLEHEDNANINESVINIAKDWKSISISTVQQLADGLHKDYDELVRELHLKQNADGTYSLPSAAQLRALLRLPEITEETKKTVEELLANTADDYLQLISDATNLITKGTTSQAEMNKFVQEYKEKTKQNITAQQAFQWNDILEAFILKPEYLAQIVQAERNELKKLNFSDQDIDNYINKKYKEILSEVKFEDFFKNDVRGINSKSRAKLKNQMVSALTSDIALEDMESGWEGFITEAYGQGADSTNYESIARRLARKEREKQLQDAQANAEQQAELNLQQLEKGGQPAIDAMREFMPEGELTNELIKSAYRYQVEPITKALESAEGLTKGSIVDQELIEPLRKAKFTISDNGVVESVGNLVDAYNSLYQQMVETGEATTAELNQAAAKILNQPYDSAQKAIEALDKGATISWEDLEKMYTDADKLFGYQYDENGQKYWNSTLGVQRKRQELIDKGIISIDEIGRIYINNMEKLAEELGWETGSPQYEAALSGQVDSVISEMDRLNVSRRAANQLSNLAQGQVGEAKNVHDLPDVIKQKLGLSAEDDMYLIFSQFQLDRALMAIDATSIDDQVLRNSVVEVQKQLYDKYNKPQALQGVIKERVGINEAQALSEAYGFAASDYAYVMDQLGFYWDTITNEFVATDKSIQQLEKMIEVDNIPEDAETHAALKTMLDDLKDLRSQKPYDAIRQVLTNYEDVSNEMINNFNAIYGDKIDLSNYISVDKETGKKILNVPALMDTLRGFGADVNNYFSQELAQIAQSYTQALQTATSLTTEGTQNQSEIESFIRTAKQLGMQIDSSAFSYDSILNAWTLDPSKLVEFTSLQADKLVKLGTLAQDEVEAYIDKNVRESLANQIDVSEYLSAENRTGQAEGKLEKALSNYYTAMFSTDDAIAYIEQRYGEIANSWSANKLESMIQRTVKNPPEEVIRDLISTTMETLDEGGVGAVQIMQMIMKAQGKEISASDIENAYRSEVSRIEDAFDQIAYGTGSLVSGTVVEILEKAGYQLHKFDQNNAVITQVGDIANAYQAYYDALKKSGDATLAALNEAKAKVLETKNGRAEEQVAIDALGDAAGMTYTTFASIFSNMNIELTDELTALLEQYDIIEQIGGNKMRIKNFAEFARLMDWDFGSEEYVSAFKAYNDSLIELNRQTEQTILDEVKGLNGAKGGQQINLTKLYSVLQSQIEYGLAPNNVSFITKNPLQKVSDALGQYGGYLVDGILTLDKNANLYGIAQELKNVAQEAGLNLETDLAEIADSIREILQSYVDAINKGIKGGLSNVEKTDLVAKAQSWGISDLSFRETAEGFQLAEESAIRLYYTLEQIDAMQAKLVFAELSQALQENNEHYETISSTMNRIVELRSLKDTTDGTKKAQYEAELAVAEQIAAVRSTSEDSSFSFMSNKIPGAQNNPINYFNNWSSALTKLQTAMKTTVTNSTGTHKGLIDYQDWYNIVTEMNNIAALGQSFEVAGVKLDGSMEAAAALIEKGAAALTSTKTGDIKVALGDIGLDFEAGSGAMSEGITTGIRNMAKSQVKMLDGLIALLETIVSMEKLGDIAGTDGKIDLGDLFPEFSADGAEKKTIKNEKVLDWINNELLTADPETSDLGKFVENAVVNGYKMRDLLTNAATEGEGLNKQEAQALTSILNSIYQMQFGNYNKDDMFASIQNAAAENKLTATIPLGDTTLIFEEGSMIVEVKGKNGEPVYQTPDGQKFKDINKAKAASMLSAFHADMTTLDSEKNTAVIKLGGEQNLQLTYLDGGKIQIKGLDNFENVQFGTYKSFDDFVQALVKETGHTPTVVKLKLGAIKLDSVTYKALPGELRKQIESAIGQGDVDALNQLIQVTPELKSLKEYSSPEEIAKALNIDTATVTPTTGDVPESEKDKLKKQIEGVKPNVTVTINPPDTSPVQKALDAGNFTATVKLIGQKTWSNSSDSIDSGATESTPVVSATGNIGLAKAQGTLMGELGPELVVSNGRYFVVGQNGPEMVDLAKDAIVFNHLQTKSLLEKGMSRGRGEAVTNERNAVAYAKGSVHGGPAMSSASSLLSALKQLRAQWKALESLSAKDLAGKGGGGGGANKDAFIKDLERWYDLLQKIAQLEQDITYQEKIRSKLASDLNPNGAAYAKSQAKTLEMLKQEVAYQEELALSQEEYFKQRQNELNTQSAFKELYRFNDQGQLQYVPGKFAELSEMFGGDSTTGKPNHTIQEQYDWLISKGYGYAMKYDSSGKEIEIKKGDESSLKSAIEAFWAKVEADQKEMQELHDSVEEHREAVLEKMQSQNELLKEIEDNQIAVQQKVLKAVEDKAQRAIDTLSDQKEAIQKGNDALIDGLSKSLEKERQLYDNSQSERDLESKRRQLAILQRSGGSAAEISNLQKDIASSSRDLYFENQQAQIDALQEASDNQIKKLEEQIDIMSEALEYQKKYGLLFEEVNQVMKGTPAEIANYIKENTTEYWGKSPEELAQTIREDLFQAEQFTTVRDDLSVITNIIAKQGADEEWKQINQTLENKYGDKWKNLSADKKEKFHELYNAKLRETGDPNLAAQAVMQSEEFQNLDLDGKKAAAATAKNQSNTQGGPGNSKSNNNTKANGKKVWSYGGHDYDTKEEAIAAAELEYALASSGMPGVSKEDIGNSPITEKTIKSTGIKYYRYNEQQHQKYNTYEDGTEALIAYENHKFSGNKNKCSLCGYQKPAGVYNNEIYKTQDEADKARNKAIAAAEKDLKDNLTLNNRKKLEEAQSPTKTVKTDRKVNGKASGGYVNHGIYELGELGTETVLTAEQTKVLRDNILSNRPNSLINLLKSYNEAYQGLSDSAYNSIADNSNTVTIEHAEVNMKVEKLADSYDAAKAGDDVMREMLNIARKTNAQNRVGR